jgi:hypothetical protein
MLPVIIKHEIRASTIYNPDIQPIVNDLLSLFASPGINK